MNKPLTEKIVLITGGSRGIGKAVALQLANLGANIAINYVRNEEAAKATRDEILSKNGTAKIYQGNVAEEKEMSAVVKQVASDFGGIDIAIHSAAMGAFKPVHKLRANQWDISLDINAKAFLSLAQKVLPFMEAKKNGDIIALSSLGANKFIPNYGAIGISKAALESLVRYLAVELAQKGIRVNAVSGGLIQTEAIQFFPETEKFQNEVAKQTPAGRLGTPEDIAKIVTFLALPDSNWITGQTIIADGGLSLL
jgi:enoyl-[acyl-carrier protein] reductase III